MNQSFDRRLQLPLARGEFGLTVLLSLGILFYCIIETEVDNKLDYGSQVPKLPNLDLASGPAWAMVLIETDIDQYLRQLDTVMSRKLPLEDLEAYKSVREELIALKAEISELKASPLSDPERIKEIYEKARVLQESGAAVRI
jgi:predicted thioredoxin/glutaredoxin